MVAADGELRLQPRGEVGGCSCDIGEARVGDERGRLAVVDDVAGFLTGEVPVDRRQPEAGALRGRSGLDELGPVRAEQRDAVAVAHTPTAQRPRELVGVGVDFRQRAIAVRRAQRRRGPGTARPSTTTGSPGPPPRTALDVLSLVLECAVAVTRLILGDPSQLRPGRCIPRRCRPSPRTGSRRSR